MKDVQKVLDEMMVQTMKETEQQHTEGDSDVSFTEKVEEVIIKEPKEDKENKEEKVNAGKEKVEEISKKVKPNDSETDTDNIRVRFFIILELSETILSIFRYNFIFSLLLMNPILLQVPLTVPVELLILKVMMTVVLLHLLLPLKLIVKIYQAVRFPNS